LIRSVHMPIDRRGIECPEKIDPEIVQLVECHQREGAHMSIDRRGIACKEEIDPEIVQQHQNGERETVELIIDNCERSLQKETYPDICTKTYLNTSVPIIVRCPNATEKELIKRKRDERDEEIKSRKQKIEVSKKFSELRI